MEFSSTVSADVAIFFENENLMSPIVDRKRTLSLRTISPPSSQSSRSSTSSNTISSECFTASSTTTPIDEIEIPADLQSQETYEFIGFNKETAATLWSHFIKAPDAPDMDFLDFAWYHIEESAVDDATSIEDDWIACMKGLGINLKLQNAIMLPEFEDLRATASCKFWLMDAIEMNYEALETLNERLRIELAHRQLIKPMPGPRKSISTLSRPPFLPVSISRKPVLDLYPERSPSAAPGGLIEDEPTPVLGTAVEAPLRLEGHTMIWRAGTKTKGEAFYDSCTQKINLLAISRIPGDFSASNKVVYFTIQKETADRYAQWAKHKSEVSELAIVQVAVPETMIRSLSVKYLWSDTDEWKKVIWYSRRGEQLPDDLEYLEKNDLWIGHIAASKNRKYERMSHYRQIQESDVLKVTVDDEERKSIQWVFYTFKAKSAFRNKCAGRIWIHPLSSLAPAK